MLRLFSAQESSISSLDHLTLDQDLSCIEKSNFSPMPLVDTSEYSRSKNAIYWNVSAWVENCFGKIVTVPDGVCTPISLDDIMTLLQYAEREEAKIIIDLQGTKNPFNSPLKNEKSILLVKLDKLAYIKKIDGSVDKYLLGPSATADQLNSFFVQHNIPLEKHIDFQGANNIFDYYLDYLESQDDDAFLHPTIFLYLRLETIAGKFIIEEMNINAKNQRGNIRDLMLSAGSPIGMISGIGVDFKSFIKHPRDDQRNIEKLSKLDQKNSIEFNVTQNREHINFSTDVTMDLLKKIFRLTERESFVCCLLLEGNGDKAISNKLNISYWTVRTHVNKILEKLEISSRLEIAFKVLELYKNL